MLGILVVIVFGLLMVYNASRLSDRNLIIAVGSFCFILYIVIQDMVDKYKSKRSDGNKDADKKGAGKNSDFKTKGTKHTRSKGKKK